MGLTHLLGYPDGTLSSALRRAGPAVPRNKTSIRPCASLPGLQRQTSTFTSPGANGNSSPLADQAPGMTALPCRGGGGDENES